MKRNILIGLMCLVIALTGTVPAFAASPASGSTLETQVKYEAIKTDWLWSVPATQTFTDGSLTKTDDVSITPANSDNVIILDEGTTIDVSLNSANTFKLTNTNKSAIPYEVKKGETVLANNDNVLHFEAGVSANTGIVQTLSFETTATKIKEAKLTGEHTDVVTFNLDIQIPVITGATFSDGAFLTWDELKLAENGTKYGYAASKVTDTSIGANAFKSSRRLTSITIPNSVTSIGNYAFQSCSSLTSITFEEDSQLTGIGAWAFYYCSNLTSVSIPNSVTSIEEDAFRGCSSLTEINIDENNKNYTSIDGVLFDKNKSTLIKYPEGNIATNYTIPNTVANIEISAFRGSSNLTSITIPTSVTSIGNYAFCDCTSLTSIEIPDSVQSIGDNAFVECTNLTSVTIQEGVTNIGNGVFYECSMLPSINIPDGVTSIGQQAFYICSSLTSITIPDSVTSIGKQAFIYCTSLIDINFQGTQAQWNAITKDSGWNTNTGEYIVHCTDGDIAKS